MVLPARSQSPRFAPQLVAVSLAVWASGIGAATDPTTALDDIYHEQEIQRQLSIDTPRDPPEPGWGIRPAFAWVVLGVAVAGAVALAIWFAAFDLRPIAARRRRRRVQGDQEEATTDPPSAPADWLRAADDLAHQGQFGEAIHLLLLGILGTIHTAGGQASRAETAREIVRIHVGAHQERLRALVGASELVHFGGRAATRKQFEDCRRDAVEFDGAASPAPA